MQMIRSCSNVSLALLLAIGWQALVFAQQKQDDLTPAQESTQESSQDNSPAGDPAGNKRDRPEFDFKLAADESDKHVVETVLEGLNNPCGLLVRPGSARPGTHEIFFSESGAGRVMRIATDAPQTAYVVIEGFQLSTFGSGPIFRIGPLGLAFADESNKKLAVGTGGRDDGQEVVQVFALPVGDEPIDASAVEHYVGPIGPTDEQGGEGNFFGLARTTEALFVTSNGDDSRGWVLKAEARGNSLSNLRRFIATREASSVTGPVGIVVNPKPNYGYLLVSQMGRSTDVRDSRLTFYSPYSGKLALDLALGLYDVVALAYSPNSGFLYAADFAWHDPQAGGVFRIDQVLIDGKQACQPVKVATVVRPTSLAFTPDGQLYVAAFGETANEDSDAPPSGALLKINGDL